ncbi:MAG: RiPP maturation radical SAM C-methyltransferase [Nannocystaceae bacterium]
MAELIHLVNMPFVSLTHPTLALGLIKSRLQAAGLVAPVHNLNLDFARAIGLGAYETLALFKGVETQVGEWFFAEAAWGGPFGPSDDEFLDLCGDELTTIPHLEDPRPWLKGIRRDLVPTFLRHCLDRLRARGPLRVVGFSCTFFQTVASLALGRLIKAEHPEVKVVYGGACFHGEMGEELIAKVPWIDAVSTGEAEDVIVPLFRALADDRPPAGLQGIVYRRRAGDPVIAGPPATPVPREVLDESPPPDFDDFFADADRLGFGSLPAWRQRLLLPFESARGCWWGQKHHCTFCGLNALGMDYRARSPDRVYEEITWLCRRYPTHRLQASDNILAMGYFHDLLPRLAEDPPADDLELFYSCKANLNRSQIAAMAAAKIRYVQPGIESLSDHLLQLMRKGVSALQNVFFLRCCREHGIQVFWNNLIRVPGERQEDYDVMAARIPLLHHLRPPFGGAPPIEVHRFSPYFFERERWNTDLTPRPWYAGLFPADRVDLARVAYYFDAAWKDVLGGGAYDRVIAATLEWSRIWREEPVLPTLAAHAVPGGLEIADTRGGARVIHRLGELEALVYRAIDAPIRLRSLPKALAGTAAAGLDAAALQAIVDDLLSAGIALAEGEWVLGLALADATPEEPFKIRSGRLKRITNQRPSLPVVAS